MKSSAKTLIYSLLFATLVAWPRPIHAQDAAGTTRLRIIVNPGVAATTITSEELKEIFLGRKVRWADGRQIVVVTSKIHEIHKNFLLEYTGMTPFQFTGWWRRRLFTGKGLPPRSFKDEQELAEYVAATDGAIGYLSKPLLPGKIKTVAIATE